MEKFNESAAQDPFSLRVKAGKRTYFFDVKATRSEDFYVTITESKKVQSDMGTSYEKHKIFLYKEDFVKFLRGMEQAIEEAKRLMPDYDFAEAELGEGDLNGLPAAW